MIVYFVHWRQKSQNFQMKIDRICLEKNWPKCKKSRYFFYISMCNVIKIINLFKLPPNDPLPFSYHFKKSKSNKNILFLLLARIFFSKRASVQCHVARRVYKMLQQIKAETSREWIRRSFSYSQLPGCSKTISCNFRFHFELYKR